MHLPRLTAEAILFAGCPYVRAAVRHHVLCGHDISRTTRGNFNRFAIWVRLQTKMTDQVAGGRK